MKLTSVEMYRTEDLPDHVVQEVEDLAVKITKAIAPATHNVSPNILLGALNWVHACVANQLVIDDDKALENASSQQARALYNNILHARKVSKSNKEFKDE